MYISLNDFYSKNKKHKKMVDINNIIAPIKR